MNENKADLRRRAFLLTLGAGGAGVAGAVAAGKDAPALAAQPLQAPEARRDAGISEHMRNYYRSARI